MVRTDWDHYFMRIAFEVATRSTCNRLHVGAVVVMDKRIKGTGYNGSPAGLPHCLDEGCFVVHNHCVRCIHAEVNALLECTPAERQGATIYVTDQPCSECAKLIITTGIKRVVYARPYEPDRDWFTHRPDIQVEHLAGTY